MAWTRFQNTETLTLLIGGMKMAIIPFKHILSLVIDMFPTSISGMKRINLYKTMFQT